MYRLNNACAAGTSLRGYVELPPAFMIERFGDGKGSWIFESENGEVFTVYELHSTFRSECPIKGLPTVREFWASWEPAELHIGGMSDSDWQTFRQWLLTEYQAHCNGQPTPVLQRLTPSLRSFLEDLSPEDLLACLSSKQLAGLLKIAKAKSPCRKDEPCRKIVGKVSGEPIRHVVL